MSVRAIILGVVVLLCCGSTVNCTNSGTAERVLKQAGYTEIEITGYRPFMASKDETFATGFKAKAPNGQIVTGAVTGRLLGGSTIRVD